MENNTNDKINYKIGKIKDYDGFMGEIVTENNLYYFTKNDIDGNIIKNDIVKFQGKTEEIFPQAYYVKKLPYIKETRKM